MAENNPIGPYEICNSPKDIVHRLTEQIVKRVRNVTADNWFTSIPLAEHEIPTVRKIHEVVANDESLPTNRNHILFAQAGPALQSHPFKHRNLLTLQSKSSLNLLEFSLIKRK